VDETGFIFDPAMTEEIEKSLQKFRDLLRHLTESDQTVYRWSQFFYIQATDGTPLVDLLVSNGNIDRDLRLLVTGRIEKLPCWDDFDLSPSLPVYVAGVFAEIAPSIAIGLLPAFQRRALALLSTETFGRRGEFSISDSLGSVTRNVRFLVEPDDELSYWRNAIEFENLSSDEFEELLAVAFPSLQFAQGCWAGITRLQGSYRDLRQPLLNTLAGLNDRATDLWQQYFSAPDEFIRRLKSETNVECSGESPVTRANSQAMARRTIEHRGSPLICDWHAKLEPHQNRIYFAIQPSGIIVGIFHKHL
jgi:hypothetical protein